MKILLLVGVFLAARSPGPGLDDEEAKVKPRPTAEVLATSPAQTTNLTEEDYLIWRLERERALLQENGMSFAESFSAVVKRDLGEGMPGRASMRGPGAASADADITTRAYARFIQHHTAAFLASNPHLNEVFDVYERATDLPDVADRCLTKILDSPSASHRDYEYALFAMLDRLPPSRRAEAFEARLAGYRAKIDPRNPGPLAAQEALVEALSRRDIGWLVRDKPLDPFRREMMALVLENIARHADKTLVVDILARVYDQKFAEGKFRDIADRFLAPIVRSQPELAQRIPGGYRPAAAAYAAPAEPRTEEERWEAERRLQERLARNLELAGQERNLRNLFREAAATSMAVRNERPHWCVRAARAMFNWWRRPSCPSCPPPPPSQSPPQP